MGLLIIKIIKKGDEKMGHNEKGASRFFSAALDFIINLCSVFIALLIGMELWGMPITTIPVLLSIIVSMITVVVYFMFDSYSTKSLAPLHKKLIKIGIAQALIAAIAFVCLVLFVGDYHYYFVELICLAISTISIVLKKIISTKLIHLLRIKRRSVKRVIIVGSSEAGRSYIKEVNDNKHLGYMVIGTVAPSSSRVINRLGTYNELEGVINKHHPYEIVIALSSDEEGMLQDIMELADKCGVRAVIVPTSIYKYFKSKGQVDVIGNMPIINARAIPLDNPANSAIKRIMDVIISLIMIITLFPVMVFVFIGVKLSSPGPAIFKQRRIGRHGQEFTMYKFRSMRINEMSDSAWTTNEDPRKTKFGTFLRRTGLDELPQLFNVLAGSMSIVGPRPEIPKYVEEYSKTIPLYKVKHQVKPGITGLAQIYGYRGNTSIERRIELDINYIENWSVYNDLKIIFITPFKMFNRNEKYVE